MTLVASKQLEGPVQQFFSENTQKLMDRQQNQLADLGLLELTRGPLENRLGVFQQRVHGLNQDLTSMKCIQTWYKMTSESVKKT